MSGVSVLLVGRVRVLIVDDEPVLTVPLSGAVTAAGGR
jgi:hypothetical protein